MKDANVTHTNSAAALMVLPSNKDHTVMVVIAHRRNSNAVQMELQQQLAKTLKDVLALQANMDVVQMALPMPKDHNSKDAKTFQQFRKRLAALPRTAGKNFTASNLMKFKTKNHFVLHCLQALQ